MRTGESGGERGDHENWGVWARGAERVWEKENGFVSDMWA